MLPDLMGNACKAATARFMRFGPKERPRSVSSDPLFTVISHFFPQWALASLSPRAMEGVATFPRFC